MRISRESQGSFRTPVLSPLSLSTSPAPSFSLPLRPLSLLHRVFARPFLILDADASRETSREIPSIILTPTHLHHGRIMKVRTGEVSYSISRVAFFQRRFLIHVCAHYPRSCSYVLRHVRGAISPIPYNGVSLSIRRLCEADSTLVDRRSRDCISIVVQRYT